MGEVAPDSLRKKLEEGRESALLSRELVTLRRDVPGVPDLKALPYAGLQAGPAIPLFEREGMRTIVTELTAMTAAGRAGAPPAKPVSEQAPEPAEGGEAPAISLKTTAPGTYTPITDLSELDLWLARARNAGIFGFDVETDGTEEMTARLLGFSISMEEGKACYVPVRAAWGPVHSRKTSCASGSPASWRTRPSSSSART